jgi:hypothetical protein
LFWNSRCHPRFGWAFRSIPTTSKKAAKKVSQFFSNSSNFNYCKNAKLAITKILENPKLVLMGRFHCKINYIEDIMLFKLREMMYDKLDYCK